MLGREKVSAEEAYVQGYVCVAHKYVLLSLMKPRTNSTDSHIQRPRSSGTFRLNHHKTISQDTVFIVCHLYQISQHNGGLLYCMTPREPLTQTDTLMFRNDLHGIILNSRKRVMFLIFTVHIQWRKHIWGRGMSKEYWEFKTCKSTFPQIILILNDCAGI